MSFSLITLGLRIADLHVLYLGPLGRSELNPMSQEFWNRFAPTEACRNQDNPEDRIYYHLVLRALCDFLTPADTVLDVGAGPGRFSHEIASLVRSVEHLDYAQAMLDLAIAEGAKRGLQNVTYVRADARDLSRYPDRHFNKVLAINTPISFAARDWKTAFTEMCRVTAQGAAFTTSNFLSAFPRILEVSLEHEIPWGELAAELQKEHLFDSASAKSFGIEFPSYRAFRPNELDEEIKALGFEIQDVREIAILCRLMDSKHLEAIIADEQLLSAFLEYEWSLGTQYGS